MSVFGVNLWIILISTVLYFGLGALWYSPLLFAKPWMAMNGFSQDDLEDKPLNYILTGINILISVTILGWLMGQLNGMDVPTGISLAVLGWIGFRGTTSLTNYLFESKPIALWLLNSGYHLVGLVIAGVLFGLFG